MNRGAGMRIDHWRRKTPGARNAQRCRERGGRNWTTKSDNHEGGSALTSPLFPVASLARHDNVSPQETFASRIVVPSQFGSGQGEFFGGRLTQGGARGL